MANGSNYGTNYAVFRWDGAQWDVVENACDYGCTPARPTMPGAYEGQIVPTACQPDLERPRPSGKKPV